MKLYQRLLLLSLLLSVVVVGLGAYVRLSDAGLGCPDWPGCYGHWVGVPDQAHEQDRAHQRFPQAAPVHEGKAWKEMIHRYLAGTLGLLLFAVVVLGHRYKPHHSRLWLYLLTALLLLQVALGMWTVTLLLKPVVVTAHLLGGFGIASLLAMLWWRQSQGAHVQWQWYRPALGLSVLVLLQIALGGWVSANYAALACQGFPSCNGSWWPEADFAHVWKLWRPLGMDAHGQVLDNSVLVAIHWLHRLGAAVVTLAALVVAFKLKAEGRSRAALALLAVLLLQLSLGITNVLASLPLPVAVGHNLGALLLLLTTLALSARTRSYY